MSRLPFELLLALRYLRPKRTFVSIITLISIIGVMLGVSVLIIVISVMSGFDQELKEKVFGFTAHVRIVQSGQSMQNYAQVANTVASNRFVKGVAPFIMGQVFLETQPENGEGMILAPALRGIDPVAETNVSTLATNIQFGNFDLSDRGLLIGKEMAYHMKIRVGDRVSVYSHKELKKLRDQRGKKSEAAILPDEYEIRGIFDAGYHEFNSLFVISSLENAQIFQSLDADDSVSGLSVALHSPDDATVAARELSVALGPDFQVTTFLEDSPLMMAVMVEKNLMLYILFFIVIVAAFGITCTLITFIVMKTREIGLMKALGATNNQVMWVFLGQSLIVSVAGVFAGVGFGMLAVYYRNNFLEFMRKVTGAPLFPPDIYGFSQLPALIVPGDIVIICGGSLIICLLAAAFPARYASKLNPVEALRHE